jgi:hypothetical protein
MYTLNFFLLVGNVTRCLEFEFTLFGDRVKVLHELTLLDRRRPVTAIHEPVAVLGMG